MSTVLSPLPIQKFFDNNGQPLANGKLFTYVAASSTKIATYIDSTGGTPNTNPIILDYRGECRLWIDPTLSYKFVLAPSTDTDPPTNPIWSVDNITASAFTTPFYPRTAAEIAAGAVPVNFAYPQGYVIRYAASVAVGGDDTTAIQTAINVGSTVYFTEGTYHANNLSQIANQQHFYAIGQVRIVKNANGDLFTSSGAGVVCVGIDFRGDAAAPTFTGHNVVMSGDDPVLDRCSSRWASGRAVLATGAHVTIIGHNNDIYQTADATATGFDIEIGKSGTVTLYHQLIGIVSTQNTGGIKCVDTGNATIVGGQFGKLHIAKGTGPGGSNGGSITCARILGNVTVELSSATFTNDHFGGAVAMTFAVGTSGCRVDDSNSFDVGATITNNGNVNNYICREVSAGSVVQIKYGDDASAIVLTYNTGSGLFTLPGGLEFANNKTLGWTSSGGTADALALALSATDNFSISNTVAAKAIQIVQSGAGQIQIFVNAQESMRLDSSAGAGNTRMLVWDVDTGAIQRVSVGIANSGGAGFKLLRIPN